MNHSISNQQCVVSPKARSLSSPHPPRRKTSMPSPKTLVLSPSHGKWAKTSAPPGRMLRDKRLMGGILPPLTSVSSTMPNMSPVSSSASVTSVAPLLEEEEVLNLVRLILENASAPLSSETIRQAATRYAESKQRSAPPQPLQHQQQQQQPSLNNDQGLNNGSNNSNNHNDSLSDLLQVTQLTTLTQKLVDTQAQSIRCLKSRLLDEERQAEQVKEHIAETVAVVNEEDQPTMAISLAPRTTLQPHQPSQQRRSGGFSVDDYFSGRADVSSDDFELFCFEATAMSAESETQAALLAMPTAQRRASTNALDYSSSTTTTTTTANNSMAQFDATRTSDSVSSRRSASMSSVSTFASSITSSSIQSTANSQTTTRTTDSRLDKLRRKRTRLESILRNNVSKTLQQQLSSYSDDSMSVDSSASASLSQLLVVPHHHHRQLQQQKARHTLPPNQPQRHYSIAALSDQCSSLEDSANTVFDSSIQSSSVVEDVLEEVAKEKEETETRHLQQQTARHILPPNQPQRHYSTAALSDQCSSLEDCANNVFDSSIQSSSTVVEDAMEEVAKEKEETETPTLSSPNPDVVIVTNTTSVAAPQPQPERRTRDGLRAALSKLRQEAEQVQRVNETIANVEHELSLSTDTDHAGSRDSQSYQVDRIALELHESSRQLEAAQHNLAAIASECRATLPVLVTKRDKERLGDETDATMTSEGHLLVAEERDWMFRFFDSLSFLLLEDEEDKDEESFDRGILSAEHLILFDNVMRKNAIVQTGQWSLPEPGMVVSETDYRPVSTTVPALQEELNRALLENAALREELLQLQDNVQEESVGAEERHANELNDVAARLDESEALVGGLQEELELEKATNASNQRALGEYKLMLAQSQTKLEAANQKLKKLEDDCGVENVLAIPELHDLMSEQLTGMRAELLRTEREMFLMRSTLDELEHQRVEDTAHIEAMEEEACATEARYSLMLEEANESVIKSRAELKSLETVFHNESQQMKAELDFKMSSLDEHKVMLQESHQLLEQANRTLTQLERDCGVDNVASIPGLLSEALAEVSALVKSLTDARSEIARLQSDVKIMEARATLATRNEAELKSVEADFCVERKELQAQIAGQTSTLQERKASLEQAKAELIQANELRRQIESQCSVDDITTIPGKLSEAMEQLLTLEKSLEEAQCEIQRLQNVVTILNDARNEHLNVTLPVKPDPAASHVPDQQNAELDKANAELASLKQTLARLYAEWEAKSPAVKAEDGENTDDPSESQPAPLMSAHTLQIRLDQKELEVKCLVKEKFERQSQFQQIQALLWDLEEERNYNRRKLAEFEKLIYMPRDESAVEVQLRETSLLFAEIQASKDSLQLQIRRLQAAGKLLQCEIDQKNAVIHVLGSRLELTPDDFLETMQLEQDEMLRRATDLSVELAESQMEVDSLRERLRQVEKQVAVHPDKKEEAAVMDAHRPVPSILSTLRVGMDFRR